MKLLVAYALEEEKVLVPFDGEVIYLRTGIAKMKTSVAVTEAILRYKPDVVVNVGTVGTTHYKVGDILVCRKFKDRDLNLPNVPGMLTFIDSSKEDLSKVYPKLASFPVRECSTGDSFVTNPKDMDSDVCDMESFCIAYVCKKYKIPFVAVKSVTDILGSNSVCDWRAAIQESTIRMQKFFDNL